MGFLSRTVYDYRRGLMTALMDRMGWDALAFVTGDFFQFGTNFHTDVQTWERPILLVVPRNGEPFSVMHELSTNHIRFAREAQRLWVDDITLYAEHPRVGARLALYPQWPEMVADLLKAKGLHRARIAADSAGGPLARAIALLPEARLIPATAECRTLRFVKCEEELALMREIAALSDWVQDRYRENIREGRLVQELDMSMAAAMVEEGAKRFPGQNLEVMRCWTLSGPASCAPHGDGQPAGARIQKGHGLVNIVIPRVNGLVVENERTWFCGTPSDVQVKAYHAATAANEAAIEALVEGNPVSAFDAAAQRVIEAAGFGDNILHRTGHGMGTLGHEFPDDTAFLHRPLMSGEVYSCEPGIYIWGVGGFRQDDTVVVGKRPEVLTKAPKDLASQTVG
ncbi:MAG: Xaa-Pro peptidase family protein [Acetobacteraceae bacterium]|jgi:Xaa-Pro aminopeptidase|nr:Xaa-Pro peptidase family protein [Acetobacteraceae bacterium]